MVPRTEIVAFPADTPPDELLEKVLADRFTRVPIYEHDIDRILGVIHLKDLIKLVRGGGSNGLHGILKPVLRVPEASAAAVWQGRLTPVLPVQAPLVLPRQ